MATQPVTQTFDKYQRSLDPYSKSRTEVAQIRRGLASHLSSHVQQSRPLSRPLSLLETSLIIGSAPHGIRGIQKEYLRCVNVNINARNEYTALTRNYQHRPEDRVTTSDVSSNGHESSDAAIGSFLDLIKTRQTHERLCVIRGYADMISQEPAASQNHFDSKGVLQDVGSMPQVPSEIINKLIARDSRETTIQSLVEQLERSVLRAKILFKKEQKLLDKIRKTQDPSSMTQGKKVEALGMTRNELINWIEYELARKDEGSSETLENQHHSNTNAKRTTGTESQLTSIQALYLRYSNSREALARAVSENLVASSVLDSNEKTKDLPETETPSTLTTPMNSIHQHLVGIGSMLIQQKAAIQQKGHLTTTLAKQIKDTDRTLDRLANESHLLIGHPVPAARSHVHQVGAHKSFEDEISSQETLNTSRKAKEWVIAADQFGTRSRHAISENLEEGGSAILEAQENLLELLGLLGNENDEDTATHTDRIEVGGSGDTWAVLDGKLGVI